MLNDPLVPLAQLIDGYQTTAVLHAAVQLGLIDRLATGSGDAMTLARDLGANADHLQRLLGVLVAVGVCRDDGEAGFVLTETGQALAAGSSSGLRQRLLLAATHYAPVWGMLAQGVREDTTAFEALHGCTPWQYREQHPETSALFNDWLRSETGRIARLIAPAIDLAGVARVADIGGGTGALLQAVLELHPAIKATLFDQPHVIAQAEAQWRSEDRGPGPATIGGDFMRNIPVQADVHLLKSILHDWDDTDALRILRNCRSAMRQGERLLVIERMLPERPADDPATHLLDVHMMLVTGGRERSLAQFRTLLEKAGFDVVSARPTPCAFTLMEAVLR